MYEVKFNFKYKDKNYIISGIAKVKNNIVYLNLGHSGDEFPCIMIEFDKMTRICKISKLRAQKFGGWKNDDRIVCMKPSLPSKGALDLLVLLSLEIVRKYIGKVTTYINDGAMVDNQYPLSWKKFWIGRGTTYSKYGFRLRNPDQDSSFFKTYMKSVRSKLNQNNFALEKYLKNIFDKRLTNLYDPSFKNPELKKIDIRGIWYLDWDYYKLIEDKVNILKYTMKDIL
jgi:hypothetical protein